MPLNRARVIEEALRFVDDDGLDALSLRPLAARLRVQAPTLYWHVANKSELLDALADAIMDDALARLPELPAEPLGDGRDWLLDALIGFRQAMLQHRDGARIVTGARGSMRRADFSEHAMATLVGHGVELQRARLLVLAGERYTVGWVLEEQAPQPPDDRSTPALEQLQERFPFATRAIGEYFIGTGRTADDLYRDGARLVLGLP